MSGVAVTATDAVEVIVQSAATQVGVNAESTDVVVENTGVQVVIGGGVGLQGPAGPQGPAGEPGPKGDPGDGVESTDQLPEGTTNLYFTDARAAAIAAQIVAPVQSQLAEHLVHPDPHAGYLDTNDVVDGGNF